MTRSFSLTRRQFGLGLGASLAFAPVAPAFAQGQMRTITNSLGTYDIPASPQRVIAIDNRLDLETALALDLPVIGYSRDEASPWVPVADGVEFIPGPPSAEHVLSLDPDLIICMDVPDSDLWPIDRMREIAPVLPTRYQDDWRSNINNLAGWLGMEDRAAAAVAQYDAVVAEVAQKHADKLNRYKVAAIHYFPDEGQVMVRGASSGQGRVLADIGGQTFDPAVIDQDMVSMENFLTLFEDVDAIFYNAADPDTFARLTAHPLWARVPAAVNDKIYVSDGNTNFGGLYAAMYLAREWDALYSILD